jgi:hypothetical protein
MAAVIAVFSDRIVSDAISPAGSSRPVLMRKPVLRRRSDILICELLLPNTRAATMESMLVLILVLTSGAS